MMGNTIQKREPSAGKKSKLKIILISLSLLLFGVLLVEVILYGLVVRAGNQSVPEKSDVLLVLGAQILGDQPSSHLRYRLDESVRLFNEGYGEVILVTGGQGINEIMPEAVAMKAYLVRAGVDPEWIIVEDKSTSTWENILFSKEIMDARGYSSAVIVTNDFHIYRGVRTARQLGIKATGAPAPSPEGIRQFNRFRETIAIARYFLLPGIRYKK